MGRVRFLGSRLCVWWFCVHVSVPFCGVCFCRNNRDGGNNDGGGNNGGGGGGRNNHGGGGGGNNNNNGGGGNFNNFNDLSDLNDFSNDQSFNTYGLSASFLDSLGIQGPLHTKVFVANVSIFIISFFLSQKKPAILSLMVGTTLCAIGVCARVLFKKTTYDVFFFGFVLSNAVLNLFSTA